MTRVQRFQFGMVWIFLLTALVAFVSWSVATPANDATALGTIGLMPGLLALSVVGYNWAGDYGKAFFAGTILTSVLACSIFPFLVLFAVIEASGGPPIQLPWMDFLKVVNGIRAPLAIAWGFSLPIGLICVGFRWLLDRSRNEGGGV